MTPIMVPSAIDRAHQMDGPGFYLPWDSFAAFVRARVSDPSLRHRVLLTYYDDERAQPRRYTYEEFGRRVAQVAWVLEERCGLRPGDRLATLLFNHDQTVILYFAVWMLGAAVVPINIDETKERKRYILEHSEAKALAYWNDLREEVESLQAEVPSLAVCLAVCDEGTFDDRGLNRASRDGPADGARALPTQRAGLSDPALIVYTSGTTGLPKGVILSACNLLIDADAIAGWHGFSERDQLMCVLPLHHVNGIVVTLLTPFYCRGGIVLNRKFRPATFWSRIQDDGVTCVSVVPTLLEYLLDANEDLSRYQLDQFGGCICGAGPLLKETAARFEDRFRFPIRHGYGLSETTCYSSFLPNDLPPAAHRAWLTAYEFPSIGMALPQNDMAILDEQGRLVPERTRGEICIRGRTVCLGYYKREDANEAAFQWGWFRSGDEGFYVREESGRPFFFISGRLKELIVRGGINIAPLEIDDVLKAHPAVKFAMAVPFVNRYYGEEIAAYVVPKDPSKGPTVDDVLRHCVERLSFSKRPKVILLGEDVPYTSTGKPKRLELKERLAPRLARYRDIQFRDRP